MTCRQAFSGCLVRASLTVWLLSHHTTPGPLERGSKISKNRVVPSRRDSPLPILGASPPFSRSLSVTAVGLLYPVAFFFLFIFFFFFFVKPSLCGHRAERHFDMVALRWFKNGQFRLIYNRSYPAEQHGPASEVTDYNAFRGRLPDVTLERGCDHQTAKGLQ